MDLLLSSPTVLLLSTRWASSLSAPTKLCAASWTTRCDGQRRDGERQAWRRWWRKGGLHTYGLTPLLSRITAGLDALFPQLSQACEGRSGRWRWSGGLGRMRGALVDDPRPPPPCVSFENEQVAIGMYTSVAYYRNWIDATIAPWGGLPSVQAPQQQSSPPPPPPLVVQPAVRRPAPQYATACC